MIDVYRLAARKPQRLSQIAAMAIHSKRASTSTLKPKKKSTAASTVGAPAQHNQSSRKGKKAWRKNVDIEDLEEKIEALRDEERTLGCAFCFSPIIIGLKL